MFRVIIAGGRNFSDYEMLSSYMDFLLSKTTDKVEIVCGMARGADKLGEKYAIERGYQVHRMPANWDKHGKSAGYKRNVEMADEADALVAFWDGKSRGTAHMIETAKKKDLKIRIKKF